MLGFAAGGVIASAALAATAGGNNAAPRSEPSGTGDATELLAPYEPIVAAAEAYRGAAAEQWVDRWEASFQQEVPEQIETVSATVRHRPVDAGGVAEMTADEQGFLRLPEPVSGPVVFEMEARAVSERACDLSVIFDGIKQGPGFQFGAHWNTRNLIWTGPTGGDGNFQSVDLPADRLITVGQWHTVRMAIEREPEPRIVASVNGHVVGVAPLHEGYDWAKRRRPMIYAYSSSIQVRRVVVGRPEVPETEPKGDEREKWREHFGERSPAEVAEAAAGLIRLLDHDRYTVREGAQRMLARMGRLAVKPMRAAWAEASPEQRWRLALLLRRLGLSPDDPAPVPYVEE